MMRRWIAHNRQAGATTQRIALGLLCLALTAGLAQPVHAQTNTAYAFSLLEGDLAQAYPLMRQGDGFTLHYQPDSFSARNLAEIAAFVPQARAHVNAMLGVNFRQPFDVYLAGTFFAPPDQSLRGRAFSKDRRIFLLFDGSGTAAERRYMLAHELTHLIAWNTYGRPKSTMLSEGAAVFAAEHFLIDTPADAFLPIDSFCLAYRRAGTLPLISPRQLEFPGHLLGLEVYYASGCFVKYLMRRQGAHIFGALYSTLNYAGLYGKPLAALEQEWLAAMDADPTRLPAATASLPAAYARLAQAYVNFFNHIATGQVDTTAYRSLDRQRVEYLRNGTHKSRAASTKMNAHANVGACEQPPDDYIRTTIKGHVVNARTFWMLRRASEMVHGQGDPLRVTQGSYVDELTASFGTHAGGGAVDISVRASKGGVLATSDMVELIRALRQAGFAAWVRRPGDLKPPVPLHIHAIAIGDRELSEAARRQMDGPEGYFRGLNGVPPENGGTAKDRHGGPVLCPWMEALGFRDLR